MNYPPELNVNAWQGYLADRKARSLKAFSERGENAAINKLLAVSTDHAEQVIILENAMATGHQGFFPKPLPPQQKQLFKQEQVSEQAELYCCEETQQLVNKYGDGKFIKRI